MRSPAGGQILPFPGRRSHRLGLESSRSWPAEGLKDGATDRAVHSFPKPFVCYQWQKPKTSEQTLYVLARPVVNEDPVLLPRALDKALQLGPRNSVGDI